MSKQAVAKKHSGERSGRHSTREVYRTAIEQSETASPPATSMRLLPPILKEQRGMATDYSCRLAPRNIARIQLERRSATHYQIDWVFVPLTYRDDGLGHHLMRQVLEDADAHGVRLSLEARACAGLSQEKLEGWYGSMGFTKTHLRGTFGPILVRAPRVWALRQAA